MNALDVGGGRKIILGRGMSKKNAGSKNIAKIVPESYKVGQGEIPVRMRYRWA